MYEDKYAICVRCSKNYEEREKARDEQGRVVCKDPNYKRTYRRHAYDF